MTRWKLSTVMAPEAMIPSAATPSRPAMRASALLTPEAMPALCSSASASTVAVSGATVIDRPSEKTTSGGQDLGRRTGASAPTRR